MTTESAQAGRGTLEIRTPVMSWRKNKREGHFLHGVGR